MASENFCLTWNDFEANISTAFRELRDDNDFFDVTLACGDSQVEAHKVILSACSPFFRGILRRNPHPHPLLYLKGVALRDIQSVLSFMYHGEVSVAQDHLNSFLAVAKELKVKGLTHDDQPSSTSSREKITTKPTSFSHTAPPPPLKPVPIVTLIPNADLIEEVMPTVKTEPEHSLVEASQHFPTTQLHPGPGLGFGEELGHGVEGYVDQYTAEAAGFETAELAEGEVRMPEDLKMYVLRDASGTFYCALCHQFSHKSSFTVRNHCEAKHFPNQFPYPCELCGDVFGTKSNLYNHLARKHKTSKH